MDGTGSVLEEMFFSEYIFGDETSWKIAGILYWLWVMVGSTSTVFHIDERRGGDVLEMLLGGYGGHVSLPPCLEPHRQDPPKVPLPEIVRTLDMKNPGPEFKRFAKTGGYPRTGQGPRLAAEAPDLRQVHRPPL